VRTLNASFGTLINEFLQALIDEIATTKEKAQGYLISQGRLIEAIPGEYLYLFSTEVDIHIPDDSPIRLEVQKTSAQGYVLSSEEHALIIALEEHIGEHVAQATLIPEVWYLLEGLRDYLSSLANSNKNRNLMLPVLIIGRRDGIIGKDETNAIKALNVLGSHQFNSYQTSAVTLVAGSQVAYVWGPPGTGKTTTLALAARTLFEKKEQILLLSHTNVAVDVMMKKVAEYFDGTEPMNKGMVVRYGIPVLPEVRRLDNITVNGILRRLYPSLISEIEMLEAERASLVRKLEGEDIGNRRALLTKRLLEVNSKLRPLRNERKEKAKSLAQSAQVLGVTLAKTFVSPEILDRERPFDAVMIDEASMAYIPYVFASASLSEKRVAVFGDFRQLAPISQASSTSARKWLQRDIFDEARIIKAVDSGINDLRLTLLATQYRMHPTISRLINAVIYKGDLRDWTEVARATQHITLVPPEPGDGVVLCDISSTVPKCYRDEATGSRYNPFSAASSVALAYQGIASGIQSIAIITPYATQARLIRRMCLDLKLAGEVYAATVHRFQGSERDVVIFDCVDSLPLPEPGVLLKGGHGSDAMRLLNVALSRARGKLIIVANLPYFRHRLSAYDTLTQIFDFLQKTDGARELRKLLTKDLSKTTSFISFLPDPQVALATLRQDLYKAEKDINIVWPVSISDTRHIPLSPIMDAGRRHCNIYLGGPKEAFDRLVGRIPNLRLWQRERPHEGIISIDSKVLWFIRWYIDESPMNLSLRIEMPKTVELLERLLELMPPDVKKPKDEEKMHKQPLGLCPRCKSPQFIDRVRTKLKVVCPNCTYNRPYNEDDALNYARLMGLANCPECRGQVIAKRLYDFRVFLCCGNYPKCKWAKDFEKIIGPL